MTTADPHAAPDIRQPPSQRLLRIHPDLACIVLLIALWLLFFWRLFTPIPADQVSLRMGDFSGQFVAFAGYQYDRFASGEVPLWNPYNNGGLPFIADTQAAVFYPPRLITIALSSLAGGLTYHALQLEMTAHVLLYTLTMYLLVRRMTLRHPGSYLGSVIAALVGGYGGFLSGYPPLQLAILEAAAWLPLALLGIHEATRSAPPAAVHHPIPNTLYPIPYTPHPSLLLTALAYGVSWLAGHPQTTFFITYLLLAYLGYRVYASRWRWTRFILSAAVFGVLGAALAAVQLLPGIEYLTLTTRAEFGFDAKGNGFPLQDLVQFIYPNVVSIFSPLYIGVAGLALVVVAVWKRVQGYIFWLTIALFALAWSFGANSVLYPALYNILPGLRPFRGQERAAFLVANSLAILAGLGAAQLVIWRAQRGDFDWSRMRETFYRAFLIILAISALVFVGWVGFRDTYQNMIGWFALAAVVAGASSLLVPAAARSDLAVAHWGLVVLVVFELFTVNMTAPSVYDRVSPPNQLTMQTPPLVAQALADVEGTPFRVDGFRGLTDNYGSLYSLADIRGISPLWFGSAHAIIEGRLPAARAWELFAVRYVFSDWNELPVPSAIVGRGTDRYGDINLHLLDDPRPFALLLTQYEVIADEAGALARLADPAFDPRRTIILSEQPDLPQSAALASGSATVTAYTPESFTVTVETDAPAILSLAHLDYPGWQAALDGEPVPILRAYGALSALVIPEPGTHAIRFVYDPLSYRVGMLISLLAWVILGLAGILIAMRRLQTRSNKLSIQ